MEDAYETGFMAGLGIMMLFYLAFVVFIIITFWKLFEKAGKPGWAAIVPIYNIIVFIEIAKKPMWWIAILFSPIIVSVITLISPMSGLVLAFPIYITVFVFEIMLVHGVSKNFGKDSGFTVGLILLGFIFFPILAFGDAKYIGNEDLSMVGNDSLDGGELK